MVLSLSLITSVTLVLLYRAATIPVASTSVGTVEVVFPTSGAGGSSPPEAPQATVDIGKLIIQSAAFARQEVKGVVDDAVSTWTTEQTPVAATAASRLNEKIHAIVHSELAAAEATSAFTPTPNFPYCGTPSPGTICDMRPTATLYMTPTYPACEEILKTPSPYANMPGRYCQWDLSAPSEVDGSSRQTATPPGSGGSATFSAGV